MKLMTLIQVVDEDGVVVSGGAGLGLRILLFLNDFAFYFIVILFYFDKQVAMNVH